MQEEINRSEFERLYEQLPEPEKSYVKLMREIPQDESGYQEWVRARMREQRQSGFEDDPDCPKVCQHSGHEPPRNLVIPEGKRYRHVCPGCGQKTYLYSSNIRL